MLMFSVDDIHEYESCLDLLIFNCEYFGLPETRVFYRDVIIQKIFETNSNFHVT